MSTEQESLLALSDRSGTITSTFRFAPQNSASRWRKNLFLVVAVLSILICLSIYLFLNLEVIEESQIESPKRHKPLSRRKPMLDHESIYSDSGPSMIKLSDLLAHCIVALRIAGREVVNLSLKFNKDLHQVSSKGKTLEGVDDIVTGVDVRSHHLILNVLKDSYRRLNIVSEEDTTRSFKINTAKDDILPIDRKEFAQLLRQDIHVIESERADKDSLITQHETLVWIDPLDATKEYSENLTDYVTLMACIVHKSVPIAGVIFKPFTNKTYWSIMDTRSGIFHRSPDLINDLNAARRKQSSANGNVRIIVSRSHAGDVKKVLKNFYGDKATIISAGGSGYKTIELLRGEADAYMHVTYIKKWDICAPQAILNSILGGRLTDMRGEKINYGDVKDPVATNGLVASINQDVHRSLTEFTKSHISLNRN